MLYSIEVRNHLHQRPDVGLRGRDPLSIRTNNIGKSFIYLGNEVFKISKVFAAVNIPSLFSWLASVS